MSSADFQHNTKRKMGAIRLSLGTAIFLAGFKLTVGILTQSVVILSLAVDSLADILSSLFNLFFLKQAEKPADEDHHFGHGKFENFGSLLQGFILFGTAGFVVFKAITKLIDAQPVHQIDLALGAIVISFGVSFFVGKHIQKVGKESHSSLLIVESSHLLMDSYLYLAAILGLVFARFGFGYFDPIAGFFVAGTVIWASAKIIKSSFDALTDKALIDTDNARIIEIIKDHYPTILGFDRFKSRKSGPKKFVNFRLFLCKRMTLEKSHDVVDHIEREIEKKILNSDVMAHAEPTNEDCSKHEHDLHPRHYGKTD